MRHRLAWLLLSAAALAAPAPAQEVRIRGDDRTRAAQIAREVLARGTYVRIQRDTVLPDSFRAAGDLVVVDAEVRLAGRVEGAVVVLGGHLFLRPGSAIGGPIAVIDGGRVQIPSRAAYSPAGSWVENEGVVPDIAIEITPQDWLSGRDVQLEAAVKAGLEAASSEQPVPPKRPAFPVHP